MDRDNQNNKFDNLAFLCLEHHDQYDSKSSQSKGLSLGEIKRYRTSLYEAMKERRELSWPASPKSTFNVLIDEIDLTKSLLGECQENQCLLEEQALAYGPGAVPTELQHRLAHERGMVKSLENKLDELDAKQNMNQNGAANPEPESNLDLSSLKILIIDRDVHWQEIYVEIATSLNCQTSVISLHDLLQHKQHWSNSAYQVAIIGVPAPESLSPPLTHDAWLFAINRVGQTMPIIFMSSGN